MTAAFTGFSPETFAWFAGLERDNSREYFHAHRAVYDEHVRGALEAMLVQLSADDFGGTLRMFRQNRDVRFSADKSPYKTATYGLLQERPGRAGGALYAELSADGLFAGAGYHYFAADQLTRFRAAVADEDSGEPLVAVVDQLEADGVSVFGEELKTAPRGFARDHPRVKLLRHKMLAGGRSLDARDATDTQKALEHVTATWQALDPVEAWLDEHVGASEIPPEERFGRRR